VTDQDINIAIAELCGWKKENIPVGSMMGADPQGWPKSKVWYFPHHLPDYCNDLNAMHEAEEQLGASDCDYVWHLAWNLKLNFYDRTIIDIYKVLHATARQRARALLRINGKLLE
jgi:hypothetical protein